LDGSQPAVALHEEQAGVLHVLETRQEVADVSETKTSD
jgi:hypothetical protein